MVDCGRDSGNELRGHLRHWLKLAITMSLPLALPLLLVFIGYADPGSTPSPHNSPLAFPEAALGICELILLSQPAKVADVDGSVHGGRGVLCLG